MRIAVAEFGFFFAFIQVNHGLKVILRLKGDIELHYPRFRLRIVIGATFYVDPFYGSTV